MVLALLVPRIGDAWISCCGRISGFRDHHHSHRRCTTANDGSWVCSCLCRIPLLPCAWGNIELRTSKGTPSFWRRLRRGPPPTGVSQLVTTGWPVGVAAPVVAECLGVSWSHVYLNGADSSIMYANSIRLGFSSNWLLPGRKPAGIARAGHSSEM
jgi:hypothetical protein